MAIDMGIARSRRALLAGGIGGLAAVVASALGRPLQARAGADGDVVLGKPNTATTTTAISNFTTTSTAFAANCSKGYALTGTTSADERAGVYGVGNTMLGRGVTGWNAAGGGTGHLGGAGWGVFGSSAQGWGVYGQGATTGIGVRGDSGSGTGVYGHSLSGSAVIGDSYSTTKVGVLGRSRADRTGVFGFSGPNNVTPPAAPAKTGVYGYAAQDDTARGVHGRSPTGSGVAGDSDSGAGTLGTSGTGPGVQGASGTGPGVVGASMSFAGVSGQSSGGIGVFGYNQILEKPAVLGHSNAGGTGVLGFSGAGMPPAPPAKTGAYGFAAQDASSRGVYGQTTAGEGVRGQATKGNGVVGYSDAGVGVAGSSASSFGVMGSSSARAGVVGASTAANQPAIIGQSAGHGTGVLGFSGGASGGLPAAPDKTGVYGCAIQDADSRGLHGHSGAGRGVYGQATSGAGIYGYATSGAGLHGAATTGYALRTSGRLKVEKASGVAIIAATKTSAVVTPGLDVTSASFVLLTPRGNLGGRSLWYTTDATNDRITIRVSSAVPADLKVGWLLLG